MTEEEAASSDSVALRASVVQSDPGVEAVTLRNLAAEPKEDDEHQADALDERIARLYRLERGEPAPKRAKEETVIVSYPSADKLPRLRGISVPALLEHKCLYDKYREDWLGTVIPEGTAVRPPPPIIKSVEHSVLEALLDEISDVESVIDITSEKFLDWRGRVLGEQTHRLVPRIRSRLKSLRMLKDQASCQDALRILWMKVLETLSAFGGRAELMDQRSSDPASVVELKSKVNEIVVEHLSMVVVPQELRDKMTVKVELAKSLKRDAGAWYRAALKETRSIDSFGLYPDRAQVCPSGGSSCATSGGSSVKGSQHPNQGAGRADFGGRGDRKGRGGGSHSRGEATKAHTARQVSAKVTERCREKGIRCDHCHEFHWVSQCPTASKEDKARYAAKRKAGQSAHFCPKVQIIDNDLLQRKKRRRSKQEAAEPRLNWTLDDLREISCCAVSSGGNEIKLTVKLAHFLTSYIAILDNGSDETLIPRSVIVKLLDAGANVELEELDQPIVLTLADKVTKVPVREKVCLDLTLTTSCGEVDTQSVICCVWDVPGEEIILGRQLLRSLGIDPQEALEKLVQSKCSGEDAVLTQTYLDKIVEDDDYFAELPDVGEDSKEDVSRAMQELFQRAVDNGLPKQFHGRVKQLIRLRRRLWRIRLANDPPADVEPFRTELKPEAKPVRCSARRYSAEQTAFLDEFISLLLKYNFIVENVNSKWASPVLVVRKPSGGYRCVIDYRVVNSMCIGTVWPMPNLEAIVRLLAGSKYWFSLDAFKGFWNMPLHVDSQEMMSFMTDKGVFTPLRSTQGHLNSAPQFQARLNVVFKELLWNKLIIYIDDALGHAATLDEWFETLSRTLEIAEAVRLTLNINKCDLFLLIAKFCGRIFSRDGVRHDPDRIRAFKELTVPRTARELQQFIFGSQWMSRHIPLYVEQMLPLTQLYEVVMKNQPKRNKSLASRVNLSGYWKTEHTNAYEKVKDAIVNHCTLQFPDPKKIQCVFSDSSEHSAAGMMTQIPVEDRGKHPAQMDHEPLGFWGHKYAGSQIRWNMSVKEGFALKGTISALDYLLPITSNPMLFFTDHKNLVKIYSPELWNKATSEMLERWTQLLQRYRYVIVHISGEENYFADIMSRFGHEELPARLIRRVSSCEDDEELVREKMSTRVRPVEEEGFMWPTVEIISLSQKQYLTQHNLECANRNGNGLLINRKGKIIIPQNDIELRYRLVIIAHCGEHNGHLGQNATLKELQSTFTWKSLPKDCKVICRECLHCLPIRGGIRTPRPLGEQVHGSRPGEVVHVDVLYVESERNADLTVTEQYNCIIVLYDNFSGLTWLAPCLNVTGEDVAELLASWRSKYGTPAILVSDQASYFKSRMIQAFVKRTGIKQHLVVSYTHFSNGTVEVVNRSIQSLLKALISELRFDRQDWPYLLECVEHTLNHRRQQGRACKAAVEFYGLKPDSPFSQIVRHPVKAAEPRELPTSAKIQKYTEELMQNLASMHKRVQTSLDKARKNARLLADSKLPEGVGLPNFDVGDYVLVAMPDDKWLETPKLKRRWQGLFRISDVISEFIYGVEDILNKKREEVHISRLRFYHDRFLNVSTEMVRQYAFDCMRWEVKKFKGLRKQRQQLEVLVEWRGFCQDEDSWEPVVRMAQDVPNLCLEYEPRENPLYEEYRDIVVNVSARKRR